MIWCASTFVLTWDQALRLYRLRRMRARTVHGNVVLALIFILSVLSTGFSPPVLTDGSGAVRLFPWQVE